CEHHKGLDRGEKQGCVRTDEAAAHLFCAGRAGSRAYLLFDPEKPGQRYCSGSSDYHGPAILLFRTLRKERAAAGKDAEKLYPRPVPDATGASLPDRQPICRPGAASLFRRGGETACFHY